VTEAATEAICVWVRLLTVLWHWPYFGIKQLIMLNLKKIRSINISTLMQYAKVYCKHSKLQLQPTIWKTFRKYLQHRLVCALHLFTWLLAAIDMKITHGLHYVSHSFPYDRKCNLWHQKKFKISEWRTILVCQTVLVENLFGKNKVSTLR
jgi:hypothetical protein